MPNGLMRFMIKSLTQVCVPVKFTTFTSRKVPESVILSVEVIVGVPVAGIVFGTSALLYIKQGTVLKEYTVDQLLVQVLFNPRTLQ